MNIYNPFSKMDKKTRNTFNKLDIQEKKDAATATFQGEISKILSESSVEFMIKGIEYERERLYNHFVKDIDFHDIGSEEWKNSVEFFLSFLRVEHIKFKKKMDGVI